MDTRPLAVLVHGTAFGLSGDGFAAQRALGGVARVITFDRRGYGSRPDHGDGELGWPVDVPDLIALIEPEGGAHVVAHSNGGVTALVLASRRPDLVRSLVLVEPNVPQAAPEHPAVAPRLEAERALHGRSPLTLDTREFTAGWMATMGAPREAAERWIASWGDAERAAADVARRERWVGDAPIDWERIRALDVPRVVALGGDGPAPPRAMMRAMGEGLAPRIGAELVVFERSGHAPHADESEPFNRMLAGLWSPGGAPR